MTWLPHGPLAASSDAFGTQWRGGGWHTLTTAQRSRERGTLLGESISSLAGAFCTGRDCSELGRRRLRLDFLDLCPWRTLAFRWKLIGGWRLLFSKEGATNSMVDFELGQLPR